MAVLVNKQTGLAEDVSDQGNWQETHDVPIVDLKTGQVGSSPFQDAQQLIAGGTHAQPSPDQLQKMLDHTKYSSPAEQAKTFAEGAAEAATFGLSTPIQTGLGLVNPEDVRGRREENPTAHAVGQAAGLIGGLALPGGAEAGALKALGEAAEGASFGKSVSQLAKEAVAAGQYLKEADAAKSISGGLGLAERVGRGMARLGTEGAAFQAGDELSQHFEDPNRSMGLSAANIGMAALTAPIIGGTLGGIAGIFKATKAEELQNVLEAAKSSFDAGATDAAPGVADVLRQNPELQGAINENPYVQKQYQNLINSNTGVGVGFKENVDKLRSAISDGSLNRLGIIADDMPQLANRNENEAGEKIAKSITDVIKERYAPISEQYEATATKYKDVPVSAEIKNDIAGKLSELSIEKGYPKALDSEELKYLQGIAEKLPEQQTVEDLRKFTSNLNQKLKDFHNGDFKRNVFGIMNDAIDTTITDSLGAAEGEAALELHRAAGSSYKALRGDMEELAARLRPGKYYGPESFIKNITQELTPEQVLNRLSRKNDAGLIQFLQEKFPAAADLIKQNQIDEIVGKSIQKDNFNLNKFIKETDKLSPQMRDWLINPETMEKIKTDHQLLESLKFTDNPSGTGKRISSAMREMMGGLGGYGLGMIGGPKMAVAMGMLGKYASDVPDAVRLAFLRSVGSGKTPDAMAFRSLAKAAENAYKGLTAVNKGVQSILPSGAAFVAKEMTDKDREKLEKAAEIYQTEPQKFIEAGNDLGRYEPEHASAQNQQMIRAMQVINASRPNQKLPGMLDPKIKPSKIEQANYTKTLQIIESPLTVFKKMKDGTLVPHELQVMKTVYPELHAHISDKIMNSLIELKADGKTLPYKQRLATSMFLGYPLDSTMMPQAIAMNQPQSVQSQAPQEQSKGSKNALTKMPGIYATSGQNREQQRSVRK